MATTRRIFGLLLALPLVALAAACDSDAPPNPILGIWGSRQGMEGEVWEFYPDSTFKLNSYVLQNNTLYREVTFAGTFTAANGTLSMTVKTTTCAEVRAGARTVSYTVAGNKLTVNIQGMTYSYTKDDAPNPDAQPQVYGCFETAQGGTFVPRAEMTAAP